MFTLVLRNEELTRKTKLSSKTAMKLQDIDIEMTFKS